MVLSRTDGRKWQIFPTPLSFGAPAPDVRSEVHDKETSHGAGYPHGLSSY